LETVGKIQVAIGKVRPPGAGGPRTAMGALVADADERKDVLLEPRLHLPFRCADAVGGDLAGGAILGEAEADGQDQDRQHRRQHDSLSHGCLLSGDLSGAPFALGSAWEFISSSKRWPSRKRGASASAWSKCRLAPGSPPWCSSRASWKCAPAGSGGSSNSR